MDVVVGAVRKHWIDFRYLEGLVVVQSTFAGVETIGIAIFPSRQVPTHTFLFWSYKESHLPGRACAGALDKTGRQICSAFPDFSPSIFNYSENLILH